jgi:hypothetical protein
MEAWFRASLKMETDGELRGRREKGVGGVAARGHISTTTSSHTPCQRP